MSLKSSIARSLHARHPRWWLRLEIARRSRHFEPEFWLLPKLCSRNALSIDVGGNEGHYAWQMAKLSQAVHVFEPNPVCLARLAQIRHGNMKLHALALSDHEGMMELRFDPHNTGVGTIEQRNRLDQNAGVHAVEARTVKVCPLDSMGLRNVSFLKIDVEGHEPSVLRGAAGLLRTEQPILLIECERRHNPTAFEEMMEQLAPLGYSAWRKAKRGLAPVTSADVTALQTGGAASSEYANNFLFFAPRHDSVRRALE